MLRIITKNKLRILAERAHLSATSPIISAQEFSQITQDLYKKNVELDHTNKVLSILRQIDALVLDQNNPTCELSQGICDLLFQSGNFAFVAMALSELRNIDDYQLKGITTVSVEDINISKLIIPRIKLSNEFLVGSSMRILPLVGLDKVDIKDFFTDRSEYISVITRLLEVESVIVCKIQSQRTLLGVLLVGLKLPADQVHASDKDLIVRISEACGVAFDNKFLTAENQRVLKELARSNQKLKALDEAKDEFISMASHQLRTPLTSIKGYLSMVLEGDAGKVSKDQEQMLSQAFTSAQRMVYLIADLLNVSRLQTGKFIIEPKDVYLPDVIAEELAQLTETAKAKEITITYNKPKEFPTLQLDDTKIRQVIMNFADNALYYTPAGGQIIIELNEHRTSVELLIVDNGIGVPKAEQHKLFAKFYRAENARKARPDGTGLGLFMAQKVIIASGGSTIFRSQEGKGSTFGFTFPKHLSG